MCHVPCSKSKYGALMHHHRGNNEEGFLFSLDYKGFQPGMAAQPMRTRLTLKQTIIKWAVTQLENASL